MAENLTQNATQPCFTTDDYRHTARPRRTVFRNSIMFILFDIRCDDQKHCALRPTLGSHYALWIIDMHVITCFEGKDKSCSLYSPDFGNTHPGQTKRHQTCLNQKKETKSPRFLFEIFLHLCFGVQWAG